MDTSSARQPTAPTGPSRALEIVALIVGVLMLLAASLIAG